MKTFKRILILVILLVLIILTVYLVGSYMQLSSVAVDYNSKIGSRYGNKDNVQYMVIGDDLNITMVDGQDICMYYYDEYMENWNIVKYLDTICGTKFVFMWLNLGQLTRNTVIEG